MINRIRTAFVMAIISGLGASASAQDGRVLLKLNDKAGQETRYVITAAVDTSVTPQGPDGLSNKVRKELSATVLVRTVEARAAGQINQEAVIEAISARTLVNGVEVPTLAGKLAGKQVDLTLDEFGEVLKVSMPEEAARVGLAEILLSLGGWLPKGEVGVGQDWKPGPRGFFYSQSLADISKSPSVLYKLSSLGDTASIEGAITLDQSGASILTTDAGPLNVNVIAKGEGSTRFVYDVASSRITEAMTETRLEGRLANVSPGPPGVSRSRGGSVVETSKVSVKLAQ
ncbi:MAG TPA: hypothetical protein VE262_10005 [Blastocatellia bacterium]|nr:hypothetical protein [Blastocatellia bacterium]